MPARQPTAMPAARVPTQKKTTGVTGITTTLSGKFQPRIKIKGTRYDLGSYETIEEAQAVYRHAKSTGKPERGYEKRHTNSLRMERGTGTVLTPPYRYHPPVIFSDSVHEYVLCAMRQQSQLVARTRV